MASYVYTVPQYCRHILLPIHTVAGDAIAPFESYSGPPTTLSTNTANSVCTGGFMTIDQALAATHRAVWALGDYALMAEEVMAPLGPILVAATGMGVGHRVLDVAAGSGNISLPAA